MNFVSNLYGWAQTQLEPAFLLICAAIGVYMLAKKRFTLLVGFLIIAIFSGFFVFGAENIKILSQQAFDRFFK